MHLRGNIFGCLCLLQPTTSSSAPPASTAAETSGKEETNNNEDEGEGEGHNSESEMSRDNEVELEFMYGWDEEQQSAWRLLDGAEAAEKGFTTTLLVPTGAGDHDEIVARFTTSLMCDMCIGSGAHRDPKTGTLKIGPLLRPAPLPESASPDFAGTCRRSPARPAPGEGPVGGGRSPTLQTKVLRLGAEPRLPDLFRQPIFG